MRLLVLIMSFTLVFAAVGISTVSAAAPSINVPADLKGYWGVGCKKMDDRTITIDGKGYRGYEWSANFTSVKKDGKGISFTALKCAEGDCGDKVSGYIERVDKNTLILQEGQDKQTLKKCKTSGMP